MFELSMLPLIVTKGKWFLTDHFDLHSHPDQRGCSMTRAVLRYGTSQSSKRDNHDRGKLNEDKDRSLKTVTSRPFLEIGVAETAVDARSPRMCQGSKGIKRPMNLSIRPSALN